MLKSYATNHNVEIYKSLEFTIEQLNICKLDSYHWKWAIIGIHNVLQICMASALRSSDGINILKEYQREKVYKSIFDKNVTRISEKLNYFVELYEDIKSEKLYQYGQTKKYIPADKDDDYIYLLNELRNKFSHYIPGGFGEYVLGFIRPFYSALRIMNFLIRDLFSIIWLDEKNKKYAIKLLDELESILDDLSKIPKEE